MTATMEQSSVAALSEENRSWGKFVEHALDGLRLLAGIANPTPAERDPYTASDPIVDKKPRGVAEWRELFDKTPIDDFVRSEGNLSHWGGRDTAVTTFALQLRPGAVQVTKFDFGLDAEPCFTLRKVTVVPGPAVLTQVGDTISGPEVQAIFNALEKRTSLETSGTSGLIPERTAA